MKKKNTVPYATIVILILCVIITLLIHIVHLDGMNLTETAVLFGAYYKPLILAGEWWRIITPAFVHINLWHLLMNLYSLWILGSIMERIFKWKKYLLLLLGSSACGYLFLFAAGQNDVTVGLSGGLYGLLAAYLIIVLRSGGWHVPQIRVSLIEMLLINAAINFIPGTAWLVHLGGAAAGALITAVMIFDPFMPSLKKNAGSALVILAIVLCVFCVQSSNMQDETIYPGTDIKILQTEQQMGLQKHAEHAAVVLDRIYGTETLIQQAVKEE